MYLIVHVPLYFYLGLAVDLRLNQVTEALTKNDANKTIEYLHFINRMSDYYTEASIMQTRAAF